MATTHADWPLSCGCLCSAFWVSRMLVSIKEAHAAGENEPRAAATTTTGDTLHTAIMAPSDPSTLYLRCDVRTGRAFIAQVSCWRRQHHHTRRLTR